MEKCPVCGSEIGEDAKACSVCGTAFDVIPPKCPLCDTDIDESATECPDCGAEIENSDEPIPDSSIDDVETAEMPSEADKETAELIATDVFVDVELEELVKLSGVGTLKAKILYDAGFTDLRTLKRASVVELMNIRGIGRKAAGEIKTALRESSLDEIRETEITKETVESEYQCPLCETIVSAYETSCYECGCIFEPGGVDDEDSDRLALSYYDSKLLRSPKNKDLWYARGATLMKMDEYDQALNSFDRALEVDKSFQAAWMSKAEVYNKLGDSTKAAECYSHIITKASAGMVFGDEDDGSEPEVEEKPVEAEPEIEETPVETEPAIEETPVETEPVVEEEPVEDDPEIEETPVETEPVVEEEPVEDEAEIEEAPVETEPVVEEEPVETEPAVEEETVETEPEPVKIEEDGPEIIKPQSFDIEPASGIDIKMDYTRPEPERPDLDSMTDIEMKKYLSKRAAHVKPYLALSKELDVNINHAKRLIAKAVAESKKGEMKLAIEIINEGIEYAETEFHRKVAEDIENMATVIRDLKVTGIDVSGAVDLITESKELLKEGQIIEAVEKLRVCLEHVERIAA